MFSNQKKIDNVVYIKIMDDDIINNNFINKDEYHFEGADLTEINNLPVKPYHIQQQSLENCFLLCAIGAIVDLDPTIINNIIRINEAGMIEVTLHDYKNISQQYVYVLEPTKIVNNKAVNKHTHDDIFLLEKAFALHRHLMQSHYEKEKKFLNYIDALKKGEPEEALTSLLGTQTNVFTLTHINTDYIIFTFLDFAQVPKKDWDYLTKNLLVAVFGSIDAPEVDYFQRSLLATPSWQRYESWDELCAKFPNESKETLLKEFFHNHINWCEAAPNIKNKTLTLIDDMVHSQVFHKRKVGPYTKIQEEVYEKIFASLMNHDIVAITTRQKLSSKSEQYHKGLYPLHAYHVVNCYQRGQLKFFFNS